MPPVSSSEFERLLDELGPEEFQSFLGDIWSARGWTTVDHGQDILVKSPNGHRHRLHVVHGTNTSTIDSSSLDDNFDIVVVGSERTQAEAVTSDGRFVGPGDLREMLLYAIDRDHADELFQQYFDRPIDREGTGDERKPVDTHTTHPTNSVRERSTTETGTEGEPPDHGQAPTSCPRSGDIVERGTNETVLAVGRRYLNGYYRLTKQTLRSRELAVGTFIILLIIGITIISGGNPGGFLSGGSPLGGQNQPATGEEGQIERYPPGVGPDGIENLTELISAHQARVSEFPYRLRIIHDGSRGAVATRFRWVQSQQRLRVDGPRNFTYRVNGTVSSAVSSANPRTIQFIESSDGIDCHRRPLRPSMTPTGDKQSNCRAITVYNRTEHFAGITARYLQRYLDTDHSAVEPLDGNRTRVVATGTPTRIGVEVSNYRAIAVITQRGVVQRLQVTYTVPGTDRPGDVRFQFRFVKIDGESSFSDQNPT